VKRLFVLLLALLILPLPTAAAADSPEALLETFMAEKGLNENNFAMGWCDLETGETWYFGENSFMVAGSMYKLPLAMAIYDRIESGELALSDMAGGYTVERALELSIVNSDNDAAQALRYKISEDRDEYRRTLASYSGCDASELPRSFYEDNCMSPRLVLGTLQSLYANRESYPRLMEYLLQAHGGRYFQKNAGEYPIAHKYGYFEGYLNDCAIVFTPRPFALVAFTKNVRSSEDVLSELCALMTDYALRPAADAAPEARRPVPTLMASAMLFPPVLTGGVEAPLWAALTAMAIPGELYLPHLPTASVQGASGEWVLSFAGDCTIGTLHEWQGSAAGNNMLYVTGTDYAYPFSGVKDILSDDDFTMVNLEGAFTERTEAKSKDYRFRASPEYVRVLTEGSVEAVTLANNHSGDYLNGGLSDTKAALDEAGVLWVDDGKPIITELSGGLKLGVIALNCVETDLPVGDVEGYMSRIEPMYEACAAENCDYIISYIHWGWEYRPQPEGWMRDFAARLAELGCDLVVGSHPHILQPTEMCGDVPVFYSLGNFCYGGHSAPRDTDSAILRVTLKKEDGVVSAETELIPCATSSDPLRSDFRPVPYEPDSTGWDRALRKLAPID
jgi:hypothetical protein